MPRTVQSFLDLRAQVLLAALALVGMAADSRALAPPPKPLDSVPPIGPAEPAPSPDGSKVAFAWAGDLWVVPMMGGSASRLTSGMPEDARPVWSPEGGRIAFARREEERWNVWTRELETGRELQLTRHDSAEFPSGFSPDGAWVLFHGAREGEEQVYRVPAHGGPVEPVLEAPSSEGVQLADGSIVFERSEHPWWRRGIRGAGNADLWMRDPSGEFRRLTDSAGPDLWPRIGGLDHTLYYVSEESFQRNVWKLDPRSDEREQISAHRDAPVLFPRVSGDGSWLVYEQGGRLWRLDLLTEGDAPEQIDVRLPESAEEPVRRVVSDGATGLVAGGGRLWLEVGGDILAADLPPTGPEVRDGASAAELGSAEVAERGGSSAGAVASPGAALADTLEFVVVAGSGFREHEFALSSSGEFALAVSDRSGGQDIVRLDIHPGGERPEFGTDGSWRPFRENRSELEHPVISPDGRFVAYVRRFEGAELRLAESSGGRDIELARAVGIEDLSFSPDGRWIAFSGEDEFGNADVYLVSLFGSGVYDVTLHPARDVDPKWSPDGKRLFFLSDRAGSFDLWGLSLSPGSASEPVRSAGTATLAHSSDSSSGVSDSSASGSSARAAAQAVPADSLVGIELSGIALRSAQITRLFGDERDYVVSANGAIAFIGSALGRRDLFLLPKVGAEPVLLTVGLDLANIVEGPSGFWLLDARGRLFHLPHDSSGSVTGAGGDDGFGPAQRTRGGTAIGRVDPVEVPYRAVTMHDPADERLQVVRQVWTELRDGFYQETLHLANWNGIRERTETRLAGIRTSGELERLLLEMAGELNASHLGVRSPAPPAPAGCWGVSLRADAGRLLVTEVLPGGPAEELGLAPGDRVFAVAGIPVDASRAVEVAAPVSAWNLSEWVWEDRSGRERRGSARAVDVARIRSLRFADRERTRKEEVGRRSAGRLAYVAPPTIDRESLDRLHREAELLQADADGLILDLRENVGGDLPEEFLRQLDRRSLLQRQPRGQTRRGAPRPLWDRPIAVLIGPGTGSAAEIVAEGLRASGRATLIGEPTLGAVIGADEIALQMGLHFRIPRIGWYTLQGENLEGRGVLPAISVNSSPGRDADPVLERAIEVLGNEARPKN